MDVETMQDAIGWRDTKRLALGFHVNHAQRPSHERSKRTP